MTNRVIAPCYVETNTTNPANFGYYTLADGSPLFDIGILFAANINGTPDQPVLSFNAQLQPVLDSGVISDIQAKGIKVTMSILGNHETAGIATLTSAGVESFVNQLTTAVDQYGLDGLDFDDECSTGTSNSACFVSLLSGVREALPDAILTMYCIGPAMNYLSYNGVDAGSLLDYAWNPYYGSYSAPQVPGMGKAGLSPAAVDIVQTPASTAASFASQTISDEYGVYMMYNLADGDQSTFLSAVSDQLYGQKTIYLAS